jgi:hypothetical protein
MGHTARRVAVILFIAVAGAAALYCAQRPTVARGSVLAAGLVSSNPGLERLDCDEKVPIGVAGATFRCKAFFKDGAEADYTFGLDRDGRINVVDRDETKPRIKKTSDPWGD